jgi:hypothetical protein
MAERIDKTGQYEYLRVDSSAASDKDRGQSGEEEDRDSGKDQFQKFQDKTDWNVFLDKSQLWKQNIEIDIQDIESVIFKNINLKTDPSLLRVDVILTDGGSISPAFIPISRVLALKMKDLKPGEKIPEEFIVKDNVLRITIPTNPEMLVPEAGTRPQQMPSFGDDTDKTVINPPLSWYNRIWIRLNIKDPITSKIKVEFTLIYFVVFLVLVFLGFGAVFLL